MYAKMDATLYKSRVEKMHLQASHHEDKIRGAAQGLAMSYELYSLLVFADCASEISRQAFYQTKEGGVQLEPSFTSDYIQGELDYLNQLQRTMEREIYEARLQEEIELRDSAFDQIKELVNDLRKYFAEKFLVLQEKIKKQGEEVKRVCEAAHLHEQQITEQVEDIKRSCDAMQTFVQSLRAKEPSSMDGNDGASEKTVDDMSLDLAEDVLDLDYDDDQEIQKEEPIVEKKNDDERAQIEKRMEELKAELTEKAHVPKRRIFGVTHMRAEEKFMRCAFCNGKGVHYSDCCPHFITVKERASRVRCRLCLDTLHTTENCNRRRKKCFYCQQEDHHTALCDLPEKIQDLNEEYDELEEMLQEMDIPEDDDDKDEPSTSRRYQEHRKPYNEDDDGTDESSTSRRYREHRKPYNEDEDDGDKPS
ncbi:unnamed protein product, partial [Nippostrongylus brasiliensis]|uniref:CCHC-type domain-containing protein n=1 Tax=Nippostrongylus brasiliensis TaxID=27835 RepID=A0A0N4YZ48_NIPBR